MCAKLWIALLVILAYATPAEAEEPRWDKYAGVLQRHIRQNTKDGISLAWLDYPALRQDPTFQQVVTTLENFPIERLQGRQEKLAFYINSYNIFAIKMVLDHWPTESIKDIGSWLTPVWKLDAGKINNKTTTLHKIEHEILRPMGEPRIHMAIVCASLSCPDLRQEPFTAARLDKQLQDQASRFLNNHGKGVSSNGKSIRISKIFDWFADDFSNSTAFIRRYHPDLPYDIIIEGYLPYNWSLNGDNK
jgi:hypothetical protein